jgi:rhamnose transport system permease protein
MNRFRRELAVAAAYAILLFVLAIAAPRFYRGDQFRSIIVASTPILVAAIGMTLVILAVGGALGILGTLWPRAMLRWPL